MKNSQILGIIMMVVSVIGFAVINPDSANLSSASNLPFFGSIALISIGIYLLLKEV